MAYTPKRHSAAHYPGIKGFDPASDDGLPRPRKPRLKKSHLSNLAPLPIKLPTNKKLPKKLPKGQNY